jgi:hypothetical protein
MAISFKPIPIDVALLAQQPHPLLGHPVLRSRGLTHFPLITLTPIAAPQLEFGYGEYVYDGSVLADSGGLESTRYRIYG